MQTSGAFNLLFRGGLRKDFREEYDGYETEYTNYLKTGSIDTPEIAATIFTGLSRMIEIDDGEGISYDSPKIGPKVMGVDKEFGIGVQISRKTVEDDQYGKMKQSAKWLAHAARMTYEYRAAAFLDDAFTGATYKAIDGQSWCSTAHTFLNATGTWANRPAADIGLSMTGVTACLDLYQTLKDHNGDPIKMMPDTLIIGNNAGDVNRAMQIFGTDKEPFTAENQDNPIKKRLGSMKVEVSRFKQSLKSYFFVNNKYNDAYFLVRRPVKMEDSFDFTTGAALYKVTTRFLIWGVDPRGWVGVNPS
jgi:hypothetical protein